MPRPHRTAPHTDDPAPDGSPAPPGAAAVRVLAHPLRSRLLAQLRRTGPATATALAALLQTNSGATSYHLRRLASVGLIRDDGSGHGRERVWAAVDERHGWSTGGTDDEDAATALSWLERDYVRHFAGRAEEWLDAAASWPSGWSDALGLSDAVALVTDAQLAAMRAEIDAVVQRYRRVGQGDPAAKRVAFYSFAYPVDLDNRPSAGSRRSG